MWRHVQSVLSIVLSTFFVVNPIIPYQLFSIFDSYECRQTHVVHVLISQMFDIVFNFLYHNFLYFSYHRHWFLPHQQDGDRNSEIVYWCLYVDFIFIEYMDIMLSDFSLDYFLKTCTPITKHLLVELKELSAVSSVASTPWSVSEYVCWKIVWS